MNAHMVAFNKIPGDSWAKGQNTFNPAYRQMLKQTDILETAKTYVTLDEHPDSINDAMFWNPPNVSATTEWSDLPASSHNGAGGFAFADGHAEIHMWRDAATKSRGVMRNGWFPGLALTTGKVDYQWVSQHSTVLR